MLSNELIALTRTLLHDTSAGFSTDNPLYSTQAIIDALTTSRDDLVRLVAESQNPPWVTVSNITKTATATSGTNVPSGFYELIIGYMTDGTYVPAQSIKIAEAMKDTPVEQIYAKAGKFFGTADNALYWGMPVQAITNTAVALTEFTDSFYHAVKYQAASALLLKEQADAKDRFAYFQKELQRKLLSFS